MTPWRVVFMGSPEFALPTLEALLAREQVVAAVTQPDRKKGRGQAAQPPPVKLAALAAGLQVLQPERLKGNAGFLAELAALAPEVIVVAAYGRILPPGVLALPPRGCINVHASLLPKYRGAAPIAWAIARGETETGVSIMQMEQGLDTGPVLLARRVAIDERDTTGTLTRKLAQLGAPALLDAFAGLRAGAVTAAPQDHSAATLAPPLRKQDGRVDFRWPAPRVRDHIRAMDPWPGAYTELAGAPLRLFAPVVCSGAGAPGAVIGADRDGLLVACGDGVVGIGELQLPGRKRMSARALLAGHAIPVGTVLGSGG
jgi:methionyl-tRNA formyltransferase